MKDRWSSGDLCNLLTLYRFRPSISHPQPTINNLSFLSSYSQWTNRRTFSKLVELWPGECSGSVGGITLSPKELDITLLHKKLAGLPC